MNKRIRPLRNILPFGKSNKIWLLICISFSLLDVAVTITIPYMYKKIIDMIEHNNSHEVFLTYIGIIIILLLLGTFNIFMRILSSSRFATNTIKDLRNNITEHLQKLPYKQVRKYHSGELASRVNDDIELIRNFLLEVSDFIYQPLIFICAMTYGLIISWKLLLVTVIVLAIAMGLNNISSKPLNKFSTKLQELYGKANSMIQDTVNGMYIVKSYNLKNKFQTNYQMIQNKAYITEIAIVKRRLIIMTIQTLLMVVPIQLINLYGGSLTFSGELTLGEFGVFLAIITYLTHPVSKFISLINNVKVANGGAERINELLSYPIEKPDKSQDILIKKDGLAVWFNHVSFSYDEKHHVLKDINFKLQQNKTIALVGGSGGGKCTILNLLCGFYPANEGEIKIFGHDINHHNTLRSQISMVTQDTHIYPTTIYENIGYGNRNATKEEIINAAKMANAHEFIMKLPNGYNTLLAERGANLSGGQKQRITIARAILKDAPILLLDEPTSALDQSSEILINEALHTLTKDKSVIIVAHRFSIIEHVDEILVIDQGTIVERGTHDELMYLDGVYKSLYLKQVKENDNDNLLKGGPFAYEV